MRLAALLCLLPLAAQAADTRSWGGCGLSCVQLRPVDDGTEAVAEVWFTNRSVHNTETLTFTLDIPGMVVDVEMLVGRGQTPDEMTVTAPEGYIAVPRRVVVPEDGEDTIRIYPLDAAVTG